MAQVLARDTGEKRVKKENLKELETGAVLALRRGVPWLCAGEPLADCEATYADLRAGCLRRVRPVQNQRPELLDHGPACRKPGSCAN